MPCSVMPAAEITTLCASTTAPGMNTTPDWLISTICPFDVRRPAITEASGPVTRFSVIDCADGSWNRTAARLPMLKLLQSSAARPLDCSTWRVLPRTDCVAWPATTRMPVGNVPGPIAGATWANPGVAASAPHSPTSAVLSSRCARDFPAAMSVPFARAIVQNRVSTRQ